MLLTMLALVFTGITDGIVDHKQTPKSKTAKVHSVIDAKGGHTNF